MALTEQSLKNKLKLSNDRLRKAEQELTIVNQEKAQILDLLQQTLSTLTALEEKVELLSQEVHSLKQEFQLSKLAKRPKDA